MIRRYNLKRSDNYPYTGRKAYNGSGNGYIDIDCGFPVTSAAITWASIPVFGDADITESGTPLEGILRDVLHPMYEEQCHEVGVILECFDIECVEGEFPRDQAQVMSTVTTGCTV